MLIDVHQEVQLLRKQRIVVVKVIAKKGERFDKTSPADHNFSAAIRDLIECGKALKHTHRVV